MGSPTTTLEHAMRYLEAGISVIPVARDGTKRPETDQLPRVFDEDDGRYRRSWKPYRERRATDEEARRWWDRAEPFGIAALAGSPSALGLEVIDFDEESETIFPAWRRMVEESCPGLVGRLCVVKSPAGYHVWYNLDGHVPANDKLARDPSKPDAKRRTLIETRGEGGYAVVPGSPPECHPDRKTWEHFSGPELWDAPCLSADEREVLVACARWFDRTPEPAPTRPHQANGHGPANGHAAPGLRPGEDFDARGPDWSEILTPHGWACVSGSASGERRWRRPGKALGWSATTGRCHGRDGGDLLRVFSSNADPFEEGKSYGRFRAWSLLNHGGDLAAAAAALSRLGYGDRPAARNGHAAGANGHARPPAEPARPAPPARPWVPFPVGLLPPVVGDLVTTAARAIDCDPAYVALPALAVTGGAVGNARALHLKRSWSEPCCFWTLTVGESGDKKSPGWRAASSPLSRLQMDAHEAWQESIARWRSEGEHDGDEPDAPPVRVTTDATIEALGELLRNNPRGVLLSRDELDGWFGGMTRYKGKAGGTDRPHWLELFQAGTLSIDRLTRDRGPLRIRRALAAVTGTIQPAILAKGFDKEAHAAGLAARFLVAMPPKRRHRWTEDDVPESLETSYRDLLATLLGLPMDGKGPRFLGLSREARRLWIDFYDRWAGVQYESSGAQAACYAKIEGYALRLMLWHQVVSDAAGGRAAACSVSPESAAAGIALARWFADEAVRVYALLGESEEQARTRELVEWVARRGEQATPTDLHQSNRSRYPTTEAAANALDALVGQGYGSWAGPEAGSGRGRPTRRFVLNPYPENPENPENTPPGRTHAG